MARPSLPSITAAQILSLFTFAVTQAVALGVVSPGEDKKIVQIAGIILPGVLMVADFVIRHGRTKISVALIEQETAQLLHLLKQEPAPPTQHGL